MIKAAETFTAQGFTNTWVHEKLAEKPVLFDDCIEIWNYFDELNSARQGSGFAILPWTWSEIITHLRDDGLADWKVREYKRMLKIMDLHYLSIVMKDEDEDV